jgi:putative FmdB family regulatory protein
MPLYGFACGWCEHAVEEFHRMAEVPDGVRKCPACDRKTLSRVVALPHPKSSKTMRTFGQQSEANAKAVGSEGMRLLGDNYQAAKRDAQRKAAAEIAKATGGVPLRPKTAAKPAEADPALVRHVNKQTGLNP